MRRLWLALLAPWLIAGPPVSGAELSAALLREVGIAPERIVVEGAALSTRDNAVLTRQLVDPAPEGRYILVTSAWHMPRSLATFRAAGWPELVPYPVDYLTDRNALSLAPTGSAARGLTLADLAAREYLASAYYFARGWIDRLMPDARRTG